MKLLDLGRDLRARAEQYVRRRWLKLTLKNIVRADAYRKVDLAYRVEDPWGMETQREQHRFAECNRIVQEHLIAPRDKVGSILEIGCGEGHQTEWLSLLCHRMVAYDVSANAIARARRRVPAAELSTGDLFSHPWSNDRKVFDIVTAFEVLYFVRDLPRTLDRMEQLGKACIVSWFAKDAGPVEPHVRTRPIEGEHSITYGDRTWTLAWWHPRA